MSLRPCVRALIVPVLGLSLRPERVGGTSLPCETCGGLPCLEGCGLDLRRPAPPPLKVVNLNQCSWELALLPRVGRPLAGRIIQHRRVYGPFYRTEDLMEVPGIGEKLFATLRPYLAVTGPTTLVYKVRSKP